VERRGQLSAMAEDGDESVGALIAQLRKSIEDQKRRQQQEQLQEEEEEEEEEEQHADDSEYVSFRYETHNHVAVRRA